MDDTGFELVAGGERVGPRRVVGVVDAQLLDGLSARYVRAVDAGSDGAVLVELGRQLFAWLDGGHGVLGRFLERAAAPVVFEVRGPRSPSARVWAVLRAPWELLAWPGGGFVAEDGLLRFGVVRRLGAVQPAAALDDFRLGLAFMAASPRDTRPELDFEAEESAILQAVGEARVDLVVDDTGDPVQLAQRLADLGGLPVVHVSCHGWNNWRFAPGGPGVAVLMLEDELGGPRPTTAQDLVGLLTVRPRLLFVSACLTATGADMTGHLPPGAGQRAEAGRDGAGVGGRLVAHSLATALVPAVIGWDGSVGDRAATVFATRLYQALADRADAAVAVGDARRLLLAASDPLVRSDWHLARLWLGPAGGGPVVAGGVKRSLVSAVRGTKTFLDRKQQHVPVAAADMFVGRRWELQQALRVLRGGDRAGVLLHGQGRLGKSSLAARIVDRLPDRAVAVVFGDYTALAIMDAVADAVQDDPQARELVSSGLAQVRDRPEAIEAVLIDLLTGPCAQARDGGRPLLLVIDDLEQILIPDSGGAHRVTAEYAPAWRRSCGRLTGPRPTAACWSPAGTPSH